MSQADLIGAVLEILLTLCKKSDKKINLGNRNLRKIRRMISHCMQSQRYNYGRFIMGRPGCPLTDLDLSQYLELPAVPVEVISSYYETTEIVTIERYYTDEEFAHKVEIGDECGGGYECRNCNRYIHKRGIITLSRVDSISDSELRALISDAMKFR